MALAFQCATGRFEALVKVLESAEKSGLIRNNPFEMRSMTRQIHFPGCLFKNEFWDKKGPNGIRARQTFGYMDFPRFEQGRSTVYEGEILSPVVELAPALAAL